MVKKSEIGIIGLGVMGKSLALNFSRNKVHTSVYNRTVKGSEEGIVDRFVQQHGGSWLGGFNDLHAFLDSLAAPRKILLMIRAGEAVDHTLEALLPYLSPGDIVMDGGNSHYKDTEKRIAFLSGSGVSFLGVGISGGEEGAFKGPSVMPGGSKEGYEKVRALLEKIAAKDARGGSCCQYIGAGGSGHFVKMVHNGIEYAEMQLLAESYDLLKRANSLDNASIASTLESWKADGLNSFLLEVTIDILRYREDGYYLLDQILDTAGQKGTGGWNTRAALEMGTPLSTISEAVMARGISSRKKLRERIGTKDRAYRPVDTDALKHAYRAARIINHGIGFDLIMEASNQKKWDLDPSEIAKVWTNGCIIRSELMEQLVEVFRKTVTIWDHGQTLNQIQEHLPALSETVSHSLTNGIPVPVLSAAINYFLGITSPELPANLIQAQRDYFGAHTYQKKGDPTGQVFHTRWKG